MATRPASENPFPEVLLAEVAAPAAAPAGKVRLYAKSDGLLYWKDDAGTEYPIGSGSETLPASIVDAKGDLIAASAADTPVRVAVGANGASLHADSGATAGVSWRANVQTGSDPTTGDDGGAGYSVGSRWINTSTDEEFVCTDNTDDAAVWQSTTDQGGGGGSGLDIAMVQFASASNGAGGAAPVFASTPDQASLFVWISCNNGAGPTALTQTNVTWTQRSSVNQGGVGELDIWTGVWDGSGVIGTTVTPTGAAGLMQAMVAEFSGADATYSALGSASILHSDNLDAFAMTDVISGIAEGSIVVFGVHTAGAAATSPAQLSCPHVSHVRQAAQAVSIGLATGLPIYGWYHGGGTPSYTLANIVP